jgi:pimeloyl-ACP methyl ester carboxylesterase
VSVWEEVVRPLGPRVQVVTVAHSTGGVAVLHVASVFPREFAARVRGLALLGAFQHVYV